MKRALVLVEGQTEERFVKDVLVPYFSNRSLHLSPTIVKTKRVKSGPDFKGGITEYQKVENDLKHLLGDRFAAGITTFIDYYGLPSDFPGMNSRPSGTSLQKVLHVEREWARVINDKRFRPFLMLHEFEALLFSKPDEISQALYQPRTVDDLAAIRNAFPTPEAINDNPQTAPSKRLKKMFPAYQKALHGPLVTSRIGLDILRKECAHFNDWLQWLESL